MATEAPKVRSTPPRIGGGWMRRYPPLASLGIAILIAVLILPSSLNLPQSNPSTVLEYAPVPPDEESPPPQTGGSIGSLGVASTSSLIRRGLDLSALLEDEDLFNARRRPLTKRCVARIQTEDPNAPPCQHFFEGDNGGATWQGVTKDEVTILIYQQTVITIDSNRTEQSPRGGTYCDVELMDCDGDRKRDPDPHVWIRVSNAFAKYFNERYQTYNRHVKVWFYWSNKLTAAGRRADAQDNWDRLRPFAVIDEAWNGGYHEEYVDSMAARDVMVFASYVGQPRSFYQSYAPLVWSFWPDLENWASQYVNYLCTKVKGTKVNASTLSRGKTDQFRGEPRKYGLMWTADEGYKGLRQFRELVKYGRDGTGGLRACGIDWSEPDGTQREVIFPYSGWAVDTQGDQSYGVTNVSKLKNWGVNTVLWLGGVETKTTAAAADQDYYPEWIVAGDGFNDSNAYAQVQDQTVWANAWAQTYQIRTGRPQDDPAYYAYKEPDPDGEDFAWASLFYRDWFNLFQAVQVAGPRLSPQTVDAGLHAIQRKDSLSPYVAACYYLPDDYTCVKDATEIWFDPSSRAPDNSVGCYRLIRDGLRYSADRWDRSIAEAEALVDGRKVGGGIQDFETGRSKVRDPCTGFSTAQGIRPGTPSGPGS